MPIKSKSIDTIMKQQEQRNRDAVRRRAQQGEAKKKQAETNYRQNYPEYQAKSVEFLAISELDEHSSNNKNRLLQELKNIKNELIRALEILVNGAKAHPFSGKSKEISDTWKVIEAHNQALEQAKKSLEQAKIDAAEAEAHIAKEVENAVQKGVEEAVDEEARRMEAFIDEFVDYAIQNGVDECAEELSVAEEEVEEEVEEEAAEETRKKEAYLEKLGRVYNSSLPPTCRDLFAASRRS